MESTINEKLHINNRYDVIKFKDKGSWGKVYLVEKQEDKKQYAAKVLKKINTSSEKEITIHEKVSKLKCPYLVNLIEFGEGPVKTDSKPTKKKQYLILDYASKGDIYRYIHKSGKGFEERHAKLIFKKILEGVQALHKSGICHRDLKPGNILFDEKFNPKICDFGYATETKGENDSGLLTDYVGTPNYAAPEMYKNEPYDGVRADIFSLGVILLNLVTKKIGFYEPIPKDDYYKYIILEDFPQYWKKVEKFTGKVPDGVKQLYEKMVSYNPDDRPSIDAIINGPWMIEIKNLNKEEYNDLETDVIKALETIEQKIIDSNEEVETESDVDEDSGDNKGLNGEEKQYFPLDLIPNYYEKTGLNMNNYMKIIGNLQPAKFMNLLANKIGNEYSNCTIEEDKEKLKFKAVFEKEEEEEEKNGEEKEEKEKIEEELKKLGIKIDDFNDTIKAKDSVIKVKLLKSKNKGYLVKFERVEGEIEDYLKNFENIKKIIKEII